MKVLVHSNKNKDKDFIQTKEIINYLNSKQIEVVVSEEMFEDFNDSNITIFNPEETDQIKFVLVLGGDGSFLRAARQYYKYHLPFLGLNLGRVGYLTECDMNNAYEMIDMVLNKQYKIKEMALLDVQIISEQGFKKYVGFNEVLIHRGAYLKMMKLNVKVKDRFLDAFYADGVIVSTTMGSSAYNLSAGGPFILDNAKCFAITTICSQSGLVPPVIVNDEDLIEITAQTKHDQKYVVVVDGKHQVEVKNGTSVFISKSNETLPLITFNNESKRVNHITKAFNGYIY